MGGVVTLSIEIELAWGIHDTGTFDRLSPDGRAEREYLTELLTVLDETRIPLTFDIVGHLFLERCVGSHESPHRNGWFRPDPGTDYLTNGLFYAPDMVSDIRSRSVDHELCTHTFSHALFEEISRETSRWELSHAQRLHRRHIGHPTRSLVPPRHQLPPYDVLDDHDIEVIRVSMQNQSATKLHRFKELVSGPLALSELRSTDGLVETTCTTYPSLTAPTLPSGQGETHPAFRWLPASTRQRYYLRKLQQATTAAIEDDGHLHLWCHLFDLSNPQQFEAVRMYLEWLSEFHDRHELTVATMEELPAHV